MSDGPRALLTDGQKRALRGDPSMSDSNQRGQKYRLEKQIERLQSDVEFLEEHSEQYAARLRMIVCGDTLSPEERSQFRSERHAEIERLRRDVERVESLLASLGEQLSDIESSFEDVDPHPDGDNT